MDLVSYLLPLIAFRERMVFTKVRHHSNFDLWLLWNEKPFLATNTKVIHGYIVNRFQFITLYYLESVFTTSRSRVSIRLTSKMFLLFNISLILRGLYAYNDVFFIISFICFLPVYFLSTLVWTALSLAIYDHCVIFCYFIHRIKWSLINYLAFLYIFISYQLMCCTRIHKGLILVDMLLPYWRTQSRRCLCLW